MRGIHLKQPGITYRACGSFNTNKERIKIINKKQEIKDIFISTN